MAKKKKGQMLRKNEVRKAFELAKTTPEGRAVELLEVLGRGEGERARQMQSEADDNGMNFSRYLETLDPSKDHKNTRTDAFGRLIRATGIVPASDMSRGLVASELEDLVNHSMGARALVSELFARMYRKALCGTPQGATFGQRTPYLSNDTTSGSILNPYAYDPRPRGPQILAALPINEIVAFNTGIDSNTYKAFYLTSDVTNTRMYRVTEGAELPGAKLVSSDRAINLYKFGRKLEWSYESARRMPIDLIGFHIQRIAVQAEADRVAAALATLVGGDGNAGTSATVYNLTTLDPATTAGNLTLLAWLTFRMLFLNPYSLTTAITQVGPALKLQMLNTGNSNIPLMYLTQFYGGFRAMNPGLADSVALGFTADAPTNQIVGFDRRFALERVFEIGASISETDKWISKQTNIMTFTDTEGYDILDPTAVKILNLAA
jgi:hypothetical protein